MSKKRKISIKEVKHIAELAHISLSDSEVRKFQVQLEDIINYFDTLDEVDTKYVEETSQVTGLINNMRKDEEKRVLSSDESLQNASDKEDGYIKTKSALKRDK